MRCPRSEETKNSNVWPMPHNCNAPGNYSGWRYPGLRSGKKNKRAPCSELLAWARESFDCHLLFLSFPPVQRVPSIKHDRSVSPDAEVKRICTPQLPRRQRRKKLIITRTLSNLQRTLPLMVKNPDPQEKAGGESTSRRFSASSHNPQTQDPAWMGGRLRIARACSARGPQATPGTNSGASAHKSERCGQVAWRRDLRRCWRLRRC